MQAFAYRHLVPAQELKVAVAGRNRLRDEVRVVSALPVRIPAGGASRVKISLPEGPFSDRIRFELSESPDGLTIAEWSATVIVLKADAAKVKPGQKGNLIVTAYAERKPTEEQNTAKANRRRIAVGVLPAIPFEITEP